jgi:hypothetical protein
MYIWCKLTVKKPEYNEPVLCFLDNGQQITLALDEDSQEWATYDEEKFIDAHVIAWKKLESREEIVKQLV